MVLALKILLIIVSFILIAGVLLQSGKSAGLSGTIDGGATAFFGKKKGLDEFFAKLTTAAAIIFMILALAVAALV
ncbi:preprotein translocase subunit SecG [Anoxybacter fermentans]|uniref:Protein-export membrane protein SecG n=1 Tax=Anoxybacter fermentans TaxID=1323375 RepID=A0A3Q9HNU5_9FIRM|nr:preprotein translocase subunit SecG [Anoxybacter fermentans]AZR72282.1 preprotein translocase subunit SecG [Anoxybacter fermentans]